MPLISTLVHGLIDYTVGTGLVGAPQVIDWAEDRTAARFTQSMGVAALAYSLCTDYELGAIKLIPMRVHLRVDTAWAVGLALGPWVFGFGRRGPRYWIPHTLVALTAAEVVASTKQDKGRPIERVSLSAPPRVVLRYAW